MPNVGEFLEQIGNEPGVKPQEIDDFVKKYNVSPADFDTDVEALIANRSTPQVKRFVSAAQQEQFQQKIEEAIPEQPGQFLAEEQFKAIGQPVPTKKPTTISGVAGEFAKTVPKIAVSPVLGVSGLISGATEAVAEFAKPGAQSEEYFRATEEDLRERLGNSLYDNIVSDIKDNIVAIPLLLNEVVGIIPTQRQLKQSFSEFAAEKAQTSKKFGEMLIKAGIGGILGTLANLDDALETRPVSTLLILLPALKAIKAAGIAVSPRIVGLIDKLDIVEKIAQKKRIAKAETLTEKAFQASKQAKQQFEVTAEEAARGVERGQVQIIPEEPVIPAPPIEVPEIPRVADRFQKIKSEGPAEVPMEQVVAELPERAPVEGTTEYLKRVGPIEEQALPELEAELGVLKRQLAMFDKAEQLSPGEQVTFDDLVARESELAADVASSKQNILKYREIVPYTREEYLQKLEPLEQKRVELQNKLNNLERAVVERKQAGDPESSLRTARNEVTFTKGDLRELTAEIQELKRIGGYAVIDAQRILGDVELTPREADKLDALYNISYDGMQKDFGHSITDMETQTTFTVKPGEDLVAKLRAKRAEMGTPEERFTVLLKKHTDISEKIAELNKQIEAAGPEAKLAGLQSQLRDAEVFEDKYSQGLEGMQKTYLPEELRIERPEAPTIEGPAANVDEVIAKQAELELPQRTPPTQMTTVTERVVSKKGLEYTEAQQDIIATQKRLAEGESRLSKARVAQLQRDLRQFRDVIDVEVIEPIETRVPPAFASLFNDMERMVAKTFATEKDVLGRPKAFAEIPEAARMVSELQKRTRPSPELASQIVTSTLRDKTSQLLRSKKFVSLLKKQIKTKLPDAPDAALDLTFKSMIGSTMFDAPFNFVLRSKSNPKLFVNVLDEIANTISRADVPKELLNEIRGEAFRGLSAELAVRVQKAKFAQAIDDELARTRQTPTATLAQIVDAIVSEAVVNNRPYPQAFWKFSPEDVAKLIQSDRGRYVSKIGGNEKVINKRLDKLVKHLEKEFQPPHTSIRDYSGKQLKAIDKSFNRFMFWTVDVNKDFSWVGELMRSLNSTMKGNLTVRNAASHIGNVTSNLAYTSTLTGQTPLGVIRDVFSDYIRLGKFDAGQITSGPEYELIRSIKRSGLLDTDLVKSELEATGIVGFLAGSKAQGLLKLKFAANLYQLGDEPFKWSRSLRVGNKILENSQVLEPGQWIEVLLPRDRKVWLIKDAQGNFRINKHNRPKPTTSEAQMTALIEKPPKEFGPEPFRKLSNQEFFDVVGEGATTQALNSYFDYSDIPNWLKAIRSTPVIGVASPFTIWNYKSLDVPGLKKGLLYNMLLGDGNIIPATNSRRVAMNGALAGIETATRRALSINAMRGQLLDKPEREVQEIFKRVPSDAQLVLLANVTDPTKLEFKNWDNIFYAQPTDLAFRVGWDGWLAINDVLGVDEWKPENLYKVDLKTGEYDFDLEELKKIDPEEAKEILARRKIWVRSNAKEISSFEDALQLAHLSGNPFINALVKLRIEEEAGRRPINLEVVANTFGPLVAGATPYKLFDVGYAMWDETNQFSARSWALSLKDQDPKEYEDLGRYAVRTLLGIGWKSAVIEKQTDKFLKRLKMNLTASLMGGFNKKIAGLDTLIDRAGQAGDAPEVQRLTEAQDSIDDLKSVFTDIIDDEIEKRQDDYEEMASRIQSTFRKELGPPAPAPQHEPFRK